MTKIRVPTKRKGTQWRGFASLKADYPDFMRRVASAGGKAVHALKTGHEWTVETAAIAGRKGGLASAAARRAKKAAGEGACETGN
jgi:general stress protein YciG